ncbi:hypothetical protein SAMN05444414_1601 [Roseovarius marisflavi]|uniref:Uncharacterized protein n=1 Tax=Roseovarius marisflavi TaxID=1054996 RepID=A0A1M7DZ49_9RHOB|nr:DUF6512 family protein [Roseovarius marisflavi]SHL84730.1 hypothetical protein SAMN05444414_1601 [Roseovarius marisflavi]
MTLRSEAILRWEIYGAIFTVIFGSLLHFVFGWAGCWRPLAVIAAVNESIWEHLKLAFWPGLVWALLPRKEFGSPLDERLAAKGITLLLTAVLIVLVFTSYTAILGRNLLLLDIGTFIFAVLAGHLAAATIRIVGMPSRLIVVGKGLLVVQFVAYASFTLFPPDFWLFVDSRTGLSGVPPN